VSVYKPRNSRIWQFDFVVAGTRYHGSTGVMTRRAAEGVERTKRNEVASGQFGSVAQMTFDAAAGRYWEEKGKHRGDADDVERRIEVLLILIGKTTKLADIHQAKVAEAIEKRRGMTYTKRRGDQTDAMKAKARKRDRDKGPVKEYAPTAATVNRDVIDTLRPILRRARTHWTPKNSQHGLPEIDWRELRLTEPRELVRTYSARERGSWVDACEAENVRLAVEMILTYGLRFGELFFEPGAFMPETDDGAVLKLQKGRKKDVVLYLPIVERHARQLAALAGRAVAAGLPHLWFDEKAGKLIPLTYGQLEYRVRKAADAGGVQGERRIHGARHHAGSAMLRKTKNLKAVQQLLGHATIASSQRYAHVLIGDLRAALEDDIPRNSPEAPTPEKKKA
jgi:integrase